MPVCRKPMSGVARVMISPSSSIMTRSTPCVEGCCGPMLRVIRLRLTSSGVGCASAIPTFVSSSRMVHLFVLIAVLVAVHRVVLAQRVALPIGRHHDAAQVGVVGEADPEQIEGLTLIPVGAAPHARNGFDLVVLAQPALQADSLVLRDGMQKIDDLEPRIGGRTPQRRNTSTARYMLVPFSESPATPNSG